MRGDKSQRAWIYAIVGAYLLYTAWQLFQGLGESEGNRAVIAIFAVFFVAAGAALIWYSIRSMRKGSGQEDSAQADSERIDSAGAPQESGREDNGEDDSESPADTDAQPEHETEDTPYCTDNSDED